MIVTAHHGTHHPELPLVPGLCLAVGGMDDGYRAASRYASRCGGEWVHEVELDLTGLVVREVEVDVAALLRTGGDFPGDTDATAYLAEGVDVLAFDDEVLGVPHRTLRLLSARALAALTVTGAYDPA